MQHNTAVAQAVHSTLSITQVPTFQTISAPSTPTSTRWLHMSWSSRKLEHCFDRMCCLISSILVMNTPSAEGNTKRDHDQRTHLYLTTTPGFALLLLRQFGNGQRKATLRMMRGPDWDDGSSIRAVKTSGSYVHRASASM